MRVSYATTKNVIKAPTRDIECALCDKMATGGAYIERVVGVASTACVIEYACSEHADPSLKVVQCCIYCGDPVRKGSLAIDGEYAHNACHKEATK